MSKFIEMMGEDIASVMLAAQHGIIKRVDGITGKGGAGGRSCVRRVSLDMVNMRLIDQFTANELDIKGASKILDGYSTTRGMEFHFAGKKLDDKDYALAEPMRSILMEARRWNIMFGFVAVRNPDLRSARILADIGVAPDLAQSLVDDGRLGADEPYATLRSVRGMIRDIVDTPAQARALERDMLGGDSATLDADPNNRDIFTPRSRRREVLQVQHVANISTLKAPEAIAYPVPVGSLRASAAAATDADVPRRKRPRRITFAGDDDDDDDDDAGAGGDTLAKARRLAASSSGEATNAASQKIYERTVQEAIIGLRTLQVVKITDGDFYLEIDDFTQERRIVMMRRDASTRQLMVDKDVFVYVWPNRMPTDDGRLVTGINNVIALHDSLQSARANSEVADFEATHPVQPLEHMPAKTDLNVERMTDQELYGGKDSGQVAVAQRQTADQQAVALYTLGVAADVLNGKRRDQLAAAINQRVQSGDLYGENEKRRLAAHLGKTNFFPLPPGFKVAQPVVPAPVLDPAQLEFSYRQALAKLVGVPISLIDSGSAYTGRQTKGGTGAGRGAMNDASAGVGDQRLELAVDDDRMMMSEFVSSLWNIMYRDSDNRTLTRVLNRYNQEALKQGENTRLFIELVKKRLRDVTDLAEREALEDTLVEQRCDLESLESRLREVQTRLLDITSRPYRLEARFTSMAHIAPEKLQMAVQLGAMSDFEVAYAVRMSLGLEPPLTEEEFNKAKEEKESAELERTDKEAAIAEKHTMKPAKPKFGAAKKPSAGGAKK